MATDFLPRLTDGVRDAVAAGADVLLASTLTHPLCAALGEARRIPTLGVYLQPSSPPPTSRPCSAACGHSGGTATGWADSCCCARWTGRSPRPSARSAANSACRGASTLATEDGTAPAPEALAALELAG
ncbi:hypothetical protein DVA86_02940 [Streptomyces armeniacus]|uniref:Uncharacterized protein n=1 Tax=Streptomyces armeniacus TaxID=83291 RepID=A0A345XJE4_9ACTN|nr:hypothetical protein [Streptomyces armeniacus]AXK31760.1 hypothetical protein DVA86_02940 [Streptomyces armeniacus]